jgi:hypothetical protein
VGLCRQGLHVGADLVRHIALRGDAVGADDDDIDKPALQQVTGVLYLAIVISRLIGMNARRGS